MAPRQASDPRADAERSFEQLYRGHRLDVYRVALRELGNVEDAEDVTQAAFVDAYRAVLRGTRPQAPRAWLLTIAENVRRRRFRTSLRRPREEPLDADAALAAEESHEQANSLLAALELLTAEQREAFLLREITGLSYDEIAERMDSTVASVQMLLFRARKTLRDELEPPHVYGALFPLTTLFSRFESFSMTPRAAGAIGATVLAVGVSASVPASVPAGADPAHATPAPTRLVEVAPAAAPALVIATRAKQPPARKAAAPKRRVAAKAPVDVTVQSATPSATAAPAAQPEPAAPPPEHRPTPAHATPPALPGALPAVSVPSVPLPSLLDTIVEPLLEEVGAVGAAWDGALPLPVRPLDPLPPIP
jgi:RNA polymerase sigma-70 factor (ECF subfamily)